jgi:class 3 adenylate cyclase
MGWLEPILTTSAYSPMVDDDRPLPGRTDGTEHVQVRTFLIADVRGYTLFTQERGDEAATKLAARFAEVAREVVKEHGGSVIELRGDEALAAFDSARQAILAAAHAQDRFLEETVFAGRNRASGVAGRPREVPDVSACPQPSHLPR